MRAQIMHVAFFYPPTERLMPGESSSLVGDDLQRLRVPRVISARDTPQYNNAQLTRKVRAISQGFRTAIAKAPAWLYIAVLTRQAA